MNLQQYFHQYAQLIHLLKDYLNRSIYQEDLDQLMPHGLDIFQQGKEHMQQLLSCTHQQLAYVQKPNEQGGAISIRQQCQICGFITSQAIAKAKVPQHIQPQHFNQLLFEQHLQMHRSAIILDQIVSFWGRDNLPTRAQRIDIQTKTDQIKPSTQQDELSVIMQQLVAYLAEYNPLDPAEHLNHALNKMIGQQIHTNELQQYFVDLPANQRTSALKQWFEEQFKSILFLKPDVKIYRATKMPDSQQGYTQVLEGKFDFLADFRPWVRQKIQEDYQAKYGDFPEALMRDLDKGPFAIQFKYFNSLDKTEGFSREYADNMAKLVRYRQGYCEITTKNSQGQPEQNYHQVPLVMLVSNLSFHREREQLRNKIGFGSNLYDKAYYQDRVGHPLNVGHFIFEMDQHSAFKVQRWSMKFLNMTYVDGACGDDGQASSGLYRRGRAKLINPFG